MRVLVLMTLALMACTCPPTMLSVWMVTTPYRGRAPLHVDISVEADRVSPCSDGDRLQAHVVEYRWDLDGDGTIDRRGADVRQVMLTFDRPGAYTVAVTVLDDRGDEDSAQLAVTVDP